MLESHMTWKCFQKSGTLRNEKDLKIYIFFYYSQALWALKWQPSHPSANHSKSWLFGPKLQCETHTQPDPMCWTEQPEIGPWSGVFTSSIALFSLNCSAEEARVQAWSGLCVRLAMLHFLTSKQRSFLRTTPPSYVSLWPHWYEYNASLNPALMKS